MGVGARVLGPSTGGGEGGRGAAGSFSADAMGLAPLGGEESKEVSIWSTETAYVP